MVKEKTCFIVTPIGDDNTAIRRHIDGIIDQAIIPAIGEMFQVKVAHRDYEIGSINDRVIQSVYNSDLVIANLTGLNPNVMFEIAIRYSFGKPAIVIAEKGTKLPFDIVDENTIFYINDPAGAADLKNTIKKFVGKIDFEKNNYGPVFASIKNAAIFNEIETKISDGENKAAFNFLVDKIGNIEENLRKLNAKYFYGSKIDVVDSMVDWNKFVEHVERIANKSNNNEIKKHLKYYMENIDNMKETEKEEFAKLLEGEIMYQTLMKSQETRKD